MVLLPSRIKENLRSGFQSETRSNNPFSKVLQEQLREFSVSNHLFFFYIYSRNLVFLLFCLFVCFFGTGNINAQSPPRQVLSKRPPRRENKRNTFDDLAFEEVMRGKRQALGDGHFDQLGVWVPESSPSEDSLKEELYRGDGSFGKSLLKAQGLFARKRREGSEQEKIVTVVSKSGRFGNEKTSDVKGIHACLALIHRRCQ